MFKYEKNGKTNIRNGVKSMILVFYILLALILIPTILALIIYSSSIEIKIKDLHIKNKKSRKKEANNNNILIEISLKIGKIKWFKYKLNKKKIITMYEKMKKFEIKNNKMAKNIENKFKHIIRKIIEDKKERKSLIKLCSNSKINIKELKTELYLGTENPIITSYLVALISIIISNILPHLKIKKLEDIEYKILPVYEQRNMYELKLNTTFKIKIKNILDIILFLLSNNKKLKDSNTKEFLEATI